MVGNRSPLRAVGGGRAESGRSDCNNRGVRFRSLLLAAIVAGGAGVTAAELASTPETGPPSPVSYFSGYPANWTSALVAPVDANSWLTVQGYVPRDAGRG